MKEHINTLSLNIKNNIVSQDCRTSDQSQKTLCRLQTTMGYFVEHLLLNCILLWISLLTSLQAELSCLSSFRFHQKFSSWLRTTSGPICQPRRRSYFGHKMMLWRIRISQGLSRKWIETTIPPTRFLHSSKPQDKQEHLSWEASLTETS